MTLFKVMPNVLKYYFVLAADMLALRKVAFSPCDYFGRDSVGSSINYVEFCC